jgi:hypothetical protein
MIVKDIQPYSISIEKKSETPAGADPVGLTFYLVWGVFAEKQSTAVARCQFAVEF